MIFSQCGNHCSIAGIPKCSPGAGFSRVRLLSPAREIACELRFVRWDLLKSSATPEEVIVEFRRAKIKGHSALQAIKAFEP